MMRRHYVMIMLTASTLATPCCGGGEAIASTGSVESWPTRLTASGPGYASTEEAQAIRDKATALHKAGDYEEAAKQFARAADVLKGADEGLGGAKSALNAIQCSLAAAQLKSGDVVGAEATCSQLLKTPALARDLRQKASYRRAVARKRQAERAGSEQEGSRLAAKAYRDAYVSLKLSEGSSVVDTSKADPKSARLVEEMESVEWGREMLTDDARAAAQAKADAHLAYLASSSSSWKGLQAGGMLDLLQGARGIGVGAQASAREGRESGGGGVSGVPGLLDMMGTGEGAGGGASLAAVMDLLMKGAASTGGDTSAAGASLDREQMVKMTQKVTKVVKKQLRNPSTQHFVCSFLRRAEPDTLKSVAGAAGLPVSEDVALRVSGYLKDADGRTLENWIDYGEIASGVFKRLSQVAVLWSRGLAIAGVWLVWVWLRACFAPIVLTNAKA